MNDENFICHFYFLSSSVYSYQILTSDYQQLSTARIQVVRKGLNLREINSQWWRKYNALHMQTMMIFQWRFPDLQKSQPTISFPKPDQVHGTYTSVMATTGQWASILQQFQPILDDQLQALHFKWAGDIATANLIHVQIQPNLVDCGVYAIANATAIAPGENFHDEKEANHLLSVDAFAFPTRSRSRRKMKPIIVVCFWCSSKWGQTAHNIVVWFINIVILLSVQTLIRQPTIVDPVVNCKKY